MLVSIPNVLANRYASDEMVAIWSPEAKIVAERRLWLAVLRAPGVQRVRVDGHQRGDERLPVADDDALADQRVRPDAILPSSPAGGSRGESGAGTARWRALRPVGLGRDSSRVTYRVAHEHGT